MTLSKIPQSVSTLLFRVFFSLPSLFTGILHLRALNIVLSFYALIPGAAPSFHPSLRPTLSHFFVLLHTSLALCTQEVSLRGPSPTLDPSFPHVSSLRAHGCAVHVNLWVGARTLSASTHVGLVDKLKETWGKGSLVRLDMWGGGGGAWELCHWWWWHILHALYCLWKGHPIYMGDRYKCAIRAALPTACMAASCRMIPLTHIAITSALFFLETVTPLMLSVPRLLWLQHVNARILHQSTSTAWHFILNWSHGQQHGGRRKQEFYCLFFIFFIWSSTEIQQHSLYCFSVCY